MTSIIATEKPGALYERLSTLRRDSFLFLLLGDIATLLDELDRSGDLAETAQLLASAQPEKQLTPKQKKAVESALRQLAFLAEALPQIKQRLELVSLEIPYAWAEQEKSWLEMLFGQAHVRKAGEKVATRGRELLARTVRGLIAPMQRSLAELEGALRPVESLLFRERIQDHWGMKVRRWGPAAVTAVLGGAVAIPTGGLSIAFLIPAFNQLLAAETQEVLKKREKILTVSRASDLAAEWIALLRRGAEVSAIEAKRFIERENLRAAERDRHLFKQCPPPLKASVLVNLRKEVQRRSADAKRAAFIELAPGSNKFLGSVTAYVTELANDLSSNTETETVDHKQIQS